MRADSPLKTYNRSRSAAFLKTYDLEGASVHEFNIGDLQFAYEWWDGAKHRMIFVLPYYVDFGDESGFMFKIFSLPTVDLADLG